MVARREENNAFSDTCSFEFFSCFAVLNAILEEYLRVITNLSVSINTIVFIETRIILVALFVVIRNQKLSSLLLILHSKPRV